jgi:Ser/Thr protein kinase RdoA (MazF antagonist)
MIEILAAVTGASISVACMGFMGVGKRNDEARDAVIRLTASVEHIAEQLTVIHADMRDANLNSVEQRVSKLEVQPRI